MFRDHLLCELHGVYVKPYKRSDELAEYDREQKEKLFRLPYCCRISEGKSYEELLEMFSASASENGVKWGHAINTFEDAPMKEFNMWLDKGEVRIMQRRTVVNSETMLEAIMRDSLEVIICKLAHDKDFRRKWIE